jgi:hypothetical protein
VIGSDRALLNRLATINISVGDVIRSMLDHMDDGQLRAADLRSIGQELALLGAGIVRRADELDHTHVINSDDVQSHHTPPLTRHGGQGARSPCDRPGQATP